MIKIGNAELEEIDKFDYDTAVKIENAVEKSVKALENISSENLKLSESIKAQCQAVFECFDDIWGDGTAVKIFGESVNLVTAGECYSQLIEYINSTDNRIEALMAKYTPKRK